MWYLTLLAIAVAVIGVWFFFKKASPSGSLDVNNDGKVGVDDVKAVADVNKDGKVNIGDAGAAIVIAAVGTKPVVYNTPVETKVAAPAAPEVVEAPKTKAPAKKKTAKKAATKVKK